MKFTGGITAFVGTVARSGNGGRFAVQPFSTFFRATNGNVFLQLREKYLEFGPFTQITLVKCSSTPWI